MYKKQDEQIESKVDDILQKMRNYIEHSSEKDKKFVRRYLSLANFKLHSIIEEYEVNSFRIAFASQFIERSYKEKYGVFKAITEPLKL